MPNQRVNIQFSPTKIKASLYNYSFSLATSTDLSIVGTFPENPPSQSFYFAGPLVTRLGISLPLEISDFLTTLHFFDYFLDRNNY